ncbi:MAG: ComF family protein [Phycisphaerae bacterium]|nr:ComF family protein [Phycisphaerae bacterium]
MTAVLSSAAGPFRSLGRGLLDAALPQTCLSCGEWISAGGRLACETCHDEIVAAMARPYCPRCGRTLPREAIHEDGCARCRTERFWNVAGVARVSTYEPVIRPLVLGLKYTGRERNADYLAELLAAALWQHRWGHELDALVPVPMHWLRRRQRPCDHARVLAEALSRRVKVPAVRLVRRAKHSPSQTRITSKNQRFKNVKGCFTPSPWWWQPARSLWRAPALAGKTVCIIDNLLMTGATVCEVSKVLRKAGAKRIYAAVIIRTASPDDPATTAATKASHAGPGRRRPAC